VITPVAALGLAAVTLTWLIGWIAPSVRRDEIRTAVVERGPVEATITAAGSVVPEYEHVITSPIESRVSRIFLTPGAQVASGQPIAQLDVAETGAAVQKLDDQVALKENERERTALESARDQAALSTRRDVKALELKALEFEAERSRNYLSEGLFSQDEVRKAEMDAERARIELREIDESLENLKDRLDKKLKGLDLEIAILRKDHSEAARRLRQATAASDRDGVLTWVVPKEGTAVRRGDELARIADLSSFRVQATVSDVHASRVGPGLPVIVESGEHRLDGRITSVRPTVENGIVTLEVGLTESSHSILRDNLRVDVYIITDRVEDALRVKRGPYMTPEGKHAVFVIRGDKAVKTGVEFGLTNFDCYQVVAGLEEGDEIIVSDMSANAHAKEVKLK
jgi:HlyD family secretion protein